MITVILSDRYEWACGCIWVMNTSVRAVMNYDNSYHLFQIWVSWRCGCIWVTSMSVRAAIDSSVAVPTNFSKRRPPVSPRWASDSTSSTIYSLFHQICCSQVHALLFKLKILIQSKVVRNRSFWNSIWHLGPFRNGNHKYSLLVTLNVYGFASNFMWKFLGWTHTRFSKFRNLIYHWVIFVCNFLLILKKLLFNHMMELTHMLHGSYYNSSWLFFIWFMNVEDLQMTSFHFFVLCTLVSVIGILYTVP